MGGTFTNLHYHIVFSTKQRVELIKERLQPRLYEYMGGIIRKEGGVLCRIGGMPDHVHLLARLRPDVALSAFLRDLKSSSSGWVHRTFRDLYMFDWQDGYAAFSVSQSQIKKVDHYIAGQREHHLKRDFKKELIGLLKAHQIPYDERYIWD